MSRGSGEFGSLLVSTLSLVSGIVATIYVVKYLADIMDPVKRASKQASAYVKSILKALGKEHVKLTSQEIQVACDLVNPADLHVSWQDIGGLDEVAESIKEAVMWPLRHQQLFEGSAILQSPKGILLYGPPGCGKTMLAKAVAAEAGLCFLNLQASTLLNLWQGETEKLTAAVFSLASKLQPAIIFIDEIDLLLRARSATDHESSGNLKGQFMSLCDGLLTDNNSQIIVLGATNRPEDIDKAILRRLPLQFHITLPSVSQRAAILTVLLRSERVAEDIDIEFLSKVTVAKSGADLKEMCRRAAMIPVRELVAQQRMQAAGDGDSHNEDTIDRSSLRPMCMADFRCVCPDYFTSADLVD